VSAQRPDFTESALDSKTVYRGRLLTVKEDRVRLPDGAESRREYIEHQGAVMILPLFEDFSVLLEYQYRYPLRAHTWELPAGKLEAGEERLVCAQRELLEETGYVASEWRHLGVLHPCVGYSNERIDLYLARRLVHEGHEGEEGEFIHTIRIALDDGLAMLERGEITESKTVMGLLWADRLRRKEK